MNTKWKILIPAAMVIALVVVAGCGGSTADTGAGGVPSASLTGAGATFPYPLYTKWFEVFGKDNPQVTVNYQSIGSGGGIKQIIAQTVDFGASDAPMKDDQLHSAPSELVHIPTVAGAVVVTYNVKGVDKGLKITPEVLSRIFLGKITKWNDPAIAADNRNLNLPDKDIVVVHRSDGSGTTNIFTDYLSSVSQDWKDTAGKGTEVKWPVGVGGKGNEGVGGQVSQSDGAIGYVELAYALQSKMAFALIKNKAGNFVEPTAASTTAAMAGAVGKLPADLRGSIVNADGADSYPIAGLTYLLVYKNQQNEAKGKALVAFISWAIKSGDSYARDLEYAPLPADLKSKVQEKLKMITYNGQSLAS